MRDLIISKPQAQSRGQRIGQRLITAGFWLLFFYLLRPLVTIFAWAVGISLFTEVMIVQEGGYDLIFMLKWYALVVIAIGMVLETWAMYNLLRFRGKERRQAPSPVETGAAAAFFGVGERDLLRWQSARGLLLHHDPEGRIVKGEVLYPLPSAVAGYRPAPAPSAPLPPA